MLFVKKNRLTQSIAGISLSLSLLVAGTALVHPHSASATSATTIEVSAAATSLSTYRVNSILRTAKSYIGKVTYRYGTRTRAVSF